MWLHSKHKFAGAHVPRFHTRRWVPPAPAHEMAAVWRAKRLRGRLKGTGPAAGAGARARQCAARSAGAQRSPLKIIAEVAPMTPKNPA